MSVSTLSRDSAALEQVVVLPGEFLHVFKARVPYVKYTFTDGRTAEFIKEPGTNEGVYYTNQEELIAELNYQILKRHPLIYVDPAQVTIREDQRDPEVRKRLSIIAELMAEGWAKTAPDNDMGNTNRSSNIGAASTSSIAATAAGGDGALDVNRLAAVAASMQAKKSGKVFVPPVPVENIPLTAEERALARDVQVLNPGGTDERNIGAPVLPPDAAALAG